MTSAPILRSAALSKALAAPAVRPTLPPGSFGANLATAQSRVKAPLTPALGGVRQTALQSGEALPFKDLITAAAKKHGVDPALLAGLVKAESNFNPTAKSGAGAKGLTQLMDATARGLGVTDSLDPAQNLDGGARFLGGLLKQFKGDTSLALAAYNAGPAAVKKYGGIPPFAETQRYVPKVLALYQQYKSSTAFG